VPQKLLLAWERERRIRIEDSYLLNNLRLKKELQWDAFTLSVHVRLSNLD